MMHFKKLIASGFCIGILLTPQLFLSRASVAFDSVAWIFAVVLAGCALRATFSGVAHISLLFALLSLLVLGVGLTEFATILLWLASSWSLGVLILWKLRANNSLSIISTTEAVLVGASLWLAVWGVMLHFAVNYQPLYIALTLLPFFFLHTQFSIIQANFLSKANTARKWIESIPFWAWVAGLAVVSWVLRWASFPSMGYDDHAHHLRMWTELLNSQRYSFDVSTQIWSVAPFTVNLLHAGLSLMAGSDARSAMNLVLAIFILLLMAGILRTYKIANPTQWLLMILMASTPMMGNLLLSLQTELLLSVLALAGMQLVIHTSGAWRSQPIVGIFSCAALCASIKLPGAVLGVTILASFAIRCWNHRQARPTEDILRWPALLLLIPLGFVALHSYAVAWTLTGNPVFPLYNAIFLSNYFDPINFSDPRWIHGFSLTNYVKAFFHTSKFFESGDFTAGWQYLILLPIALLALLHAHTPSGLRIILVPVLGFGLIMFSATQYWRYLFPIMPLAGILFGSIFIHKKSKIKNIAFIIGIACIAANLLFFTRISWIMSAPASLAFTKDGSNTLINRYAPAASLTNKINTIAPGSRVLYTKDIPYGATLDGKPLYLNWYQPNQEKAFNAIKNLDELSEYLSKERIDFAILSMSTPPSFSEGLLREYMAKYGYIEDQSNNSILYRISDAPIQYKKIFELQESEKTYSPHQIEGKTVAASTNAQKLASIATERAKQARYTVEFLCPSENGYFIAQINWDKGNPYYRLVACEKTNITFSEAISIPIGARQGSIHITSRETSPIEIKNIVLEIS